MKATLTEINAMPLSIINTPHSRSHSGWPRKLKSP